MKFYSVSEVFFFLLFILSSFRARGLDVTLEFQMELRFPVDL